MSLATTNKEMNEDTIDFSVIIKRALFHWPLYLLILLLSIASGFLYLRYKKQVYSSSAKIFIKDNKSSNSLTSPLDGLSLFGRGKGVENEMDVITSPLILKDVIASNKFNIRYFEKGRVSNIELYGSLPLILNCISDSSNVGNYFFDVFIKNDNQVEISYKNRGNDKLSRITAFFNQPFTVKKDKFSLSYFPYNSPNNFKTYQIRVDSILPLAYQKSNEITASLTSRGGSVFQLTYEDEVPKRTADFLNAVLENYNNYTLRDKNSIAVNTIKFIDTRLQSLGGELSSVEKDVENFKKSRRITELGETSRLFLEQVKDADQRLNEANIQLTIYDQIDKYINSNSGQSNLTPALGNIDQALVSVINRYQDLMKERTRLSLSLQPTSAIIQNLEEQISGAKETIKSYVDVYRKNALTTREALQTKVSQIEGMISEVPTYEREILNIKREQIVKENLYSFLLQKREESAVASASNIIDNKIIFPAFIPTKPIRPNKLLVLISFSIIGLILPSLYLFVKYVSNNNINSKSDIEGMFNTPIVAEIFQEVEDKTTALSAERSILREQVLNLRNNLMFILNNLESTPVIMFTSSISGEGKTFLSSHLAASLTYNNKKVVMLELDLRKPKLSNSLGINNASGITNYLIGAENIDSIIRSVPNQARLFIVPSGPVPPNPVELLESNRMKELFQLLKQRFDYIIIDTSPLGLVSDAKSLASFVDCLLYVIRFNYTPKAKLMDMVQTIEAGIFKRKGLVFNGINSESSYAYNSYGYSNYGYGYGNATDRTSLLPSLIKGIRQRIF